ncbi:spore cortex-lytic enzyme [Shouchella shacheensis]|uniref:spore cortex-lytic enzyme n=1 Tax=Shouchella shacheensis TaxID=1649580 RepID=UPI00074037D4|nr:spore cortex-lytic enzyme [Shouchella shacheensis]
MVNIRRVSKFVLRAGAVLGLAASLSLTGTEAADAFSKQVIQKGATGNDVVELQARLQYVGYYNGTVDGVYGWGTYWAVRNYQNEYGIEVDGLVGDQMKNKLAKSTEYNEEFVQKALKEGRKFSHYGGTPKDVQKGEKGSADRGQRGQQGSTGGQDEGSSQGGGEQEPGENQAPENGQDQPQGNQEPGGEEGGAPAPEQPDAQDNEPTIEKAQNAPAGYSNNDIELMAQAVYGEARGEPYEGQVAVAAIIVNRLNSATFPDTVPGVIYEERAFTAVADGQINLGADENARQAVLDALNGQDPTNNCLYYFNPDTATSGWIWTRDQAKRIGKHIFAY